MQSSILEFPEVKLTKISVKDYEFLCRENPVQYEKTELFEGVIVEKTTKSNEHDFYSQEFYELIQGILPEGYFIRRESSIHLPDSDFEPDILVLSGKNKDYRFQKPETARLIIEISISSLNYDREKAKAYAKGNVEEYWIVDVANKSVEVYTNPQAGVYQEQKKFDFQKEIPLFEKTISLKHI